MNLAEGRRWKKQLRREIAADHKKRDRALLAKLRAKVRDVKRRRREAMAKIVGACRVGRVRARARAKERVKALRDELRETIRQVRIDEKLRARAACNARKSKVRAAGLSAREKRRAILKAERIYQRQVSNADRRIRRQENRNRRRTSAAERAQESDDDVRQNIPPELLDVFERVKRGIKGSDRRSRSEAFVEWVEENPREVLNMQNDINDRAVARLVREQQTLERDLRDPDRYRPDDDDDIPF
jgi:hypothetical protein